MFDGQNVVVDQLVKIIQALQVGRTTGTLVATRGDGASYEVGTLVFVQGRVVQAKVGRKQDREALNWLSTWGRCRYTFVHSVSSESKMSEEISREIQGRVTGPLREKTTGPIQHAAGSINEMVPYRSKPLEYGLQVIEEKGLSRAYKHLFLLVDGQREIIELMRLLKLNEFEVLEMLYGLQDVGIISIPNPLAL
jgi:Domain of unknown function (DUF4388)